MVLRPQPLEERPPLSLPVTLSGLGDRSGRPPNPSTSIWRAHSPEAHYSSYWLPEVSLSLLHGPLTTASPQVFPQSHSFPKLWFHPLAGSASPHPTGRRALSLDPQLSLNHEVWPETQLHFAPFNLGIAPLLPTPRSPTLPRRSRPSQALPTSSLPTVGSPRLPRLPQASLACNDSNSQAPMVLKLLPVSGARPRSPYSRLLLVSPTPGPNQSEASGRQARSR